MLMTELAIVLVLILVNGALAMAELAVVSSRPARLRAMAERGVRGARAAARLASDPGRFLSTVQIGITLIGVLSGAFSGATLGARLVEWLAARGFSPAMAEPLGVGLVVASITYASLIVGELVPKQIALRNPERIAAMVAPAMRALAMLGSPLVFVLDASGRILMRALGYGAAEEQQVSDEEIRALVAEAETAGVLEPGERAMIAGVMRLGDRPVRGVMTPRGEVDMVDLDGEPEAIRAKLIASGHSRLPAYRGKTENMLGVLQAKDLLDAFLRGETPDPAAHVRPAPIVPDAADALDVVEMIKKASVHVALVFDEYGHFQGIVTDADILEAIAGGFGTAEGPPEPHAVRRDDGSWLISGAMPADEMLDLLSLPASEDKSYQTAAGFVLAHIGRLPEIGESFDANGWRFEVVDKDGRRIDKILARRLMLGQRRAAG
ncbi:hemolysin family protein [Methylosinus sp. Sm6]|uniref:hemolysin family protein n=1 Tax=Methylosinus sp. Sm6 TaxID=2866948 RepID=UPI001C9919F0|nr:hemolysin family protein [Methylosinus sp. Sm6]MBY6242191.1 hemolysin family protein [Methylosinus sp. Sm6]